MDLRDEHVVVETDRHRIEGTVTMPREGYRSRLSDFVNERDRDFFSVKDVTIAPLGGAAEAESVAFLLVARRHVRVITPTP